ncbi:AbrB/MazE/SpoVT family DNA-binding domain-containing protein [Algiphilus sp. NNCM1]|uniref:AbrB/MazE/SpoVT family DNA-binding domain-containing protein n=1 Tax=Algiphilus sp. TaxID=1872431 RepID=UPI001CA617D1|nr:AbrB/MazE/SpoVT family DNA-binding domain-containing protein [Algiphilus sp.]MBY8965964.1 AbrB/MazE/SpoVT family DNA-binding domain-containing protein [Algiphilus acroporae]MCI5062388.1 AbrB/MazE/SpoVT family DNA-binding domain-containing protein [Algiphilus sp.]MCI5102314.1 AbrB/MazE/SpoVT family DNA-binding domain-containing protein [Algiphilus sp.]
MATLTITSKGQVTIRKELLKHLSSGPGDKLEVDLLPGGELVVRAAPKDSIHTVFGRLEGKSTKVASIEELREASAAGWAGTKS